MDNSPGRTRSRTIRKPKDIYGTRVRGERRKPKIVKKKSSTRKGKDSKNKNNTKPINSSTTSTNSSTNSSTTSTTTSTTSSTTSTASSTTTTPRKRGRPRKIRPEGSSDTAVKKPSTSSTTSSTTTTPRKRGRPRKKPKVDDAGDDDAAKKMIDDAEEEAIESVGSSASEKEEEEEEKAFKNSESSSEQDDDEDEENDDDEESVDKEKNVGNGNRKPKTYVAMITDAINKSKTGKLPMVKIAEYISSSYDVPKRYESSIKRALEREVTRGRFVKKGALYSLGEGKPKAESTTKEEKTVASKNITPVKRGRGRPPKSANKQKAASPKTTAKRTPPRKTTAKTKKALAEETSSDDDGDTAMKDVANDEDDDASWTSSRSSSPLHSKKRKRSSSTGDEKQAKKPRRPTLRREPTATLEVAPTRIPRTEPKTKLEIIFSFDTTGSMYEVLESVRDKIGEMVNQLLADLPGIRIGVIAHGDYEQTKVEPYTIKTLDFCTDVDEIVAFVLGVEKTYGGDWEEAYELALQKARTDFSWTEGHCRALVVIGDAVPHTKDQYQKIDWEEEVSLLAKDLVKIYAVQCNTDNAQTTQFFQELAQKTGGTHVRIGEFETMKELFIGLCYREAVEEQFHAREVEIREKIAKLTKGGSATLLLNEEDQELSGQDLSNEQILKIHNSIHDSSITSVEINGENHDISVGAAGCRFVRIGERMFIQQNKEKDSKYAKMALEGKAITWICRQGRWGLIVDNDIVRK